MSRAKSDVDRPSRKWRHLMPDRLTTWRLFRADLEPLGLTADTEFREMPSGFVVRAGAAGVAIRYDISRDYVTEAQAVIGEILQQGEVKARRAYAQLVEQTPEYVPPLAQFCLALLLAERLSLRIPRGATAECAEWTPILRACAQKLHDDIALEMQMCELAGSSVRAVSPWINELLRRARSINDVRLSAADLTGYALAENIAWTKIGLKPPADDVEYFARHYLDGPVTFNREGERLAQQIIEHLTPARPAGASGTRLLTAPMVRLLERESERFRQMLASLGR